MEGPEAALRPCSGEEEEESSSGSSDSSSDEPCCQCSGFVAAVSNFSIQYNYACASVATAVMASHNDHTGPKVHADFREPDWAKEFLLSLVFIGSVFGMLTMGYLGDVIGIRRALIVTNLNAVLGALISVASWGGAESVWRTIAVGRFLLGFGVGGNYPLSAAKASESTPSVAEASKKAADAFFWQGPGSCAPYVLGLLLLLLPSSEYRTSLQFRILLGVGALPSAVVLWAAVREPEVARPQQRYDRLRQALSQPRHWRALVGTAGTWLLFDVAFYGNVIFVPVILSRVFGKGKSLSAMAWHAAFLSFLGIVGTMGGVSAVNHIGPKKLNNIGLTIGAFLFGSFALVYRFLSYPRMLFALLCLINFTMYFSANIATYLLPVVSFPSDVRSTFHGLSAAAAKVGAMLGALLFPIIELHFGTAAVMSTQAVVCLAGALLCHFCVENRGLQDAEEDAGDCAEEDAVELQKIKA